MHVGEFIVNIMRIYMEENVMWQIAPMIKWLGHRPVEGTKVNGNNI
jgi:hypothetical protein